MKSETIFLDITINFCYIISQPEKEENYDVQQIRPNR